LQGTKKSLSKWLVVGIWVGGLGALAGTVAMILLAFTNIRDGHGLDRFRSHWLVDDNWIGFAVFFFITLIVVSVAAVIAWLQRRSERQELRQLRAKYSEKPHE
jgi:cell division protein FtsX